MFAFGDVMHHTKGEDDIAGGVAEMPATFMNYADLTGILAYESMLDFVAIAMLA